ncbi:MAG: hypothetical protein GEV04_01750 [Actinophytocola sp.]|nr:hypothetical protein [Actinophytocola sp.]
MTRRNNVANAKKVAKDRIDPAWPQAQDSDHPVSELAADRQGSLSPFGEVTFPLESVPYEHPETEINKTP